MLPSLRAPRARYAAAPKGSATTFPASSLTFRAPSLAGFNRIGLSAQNRLLSLLLTRLW
jgi:hypothetical protein